MEECPPKFLSLLLTADPHYIPGFTGYCPQLKYNMGKSHGQLTSEILRRPDIKCSAHQAFNRGHVPTAQSDPAVPLKMIPGYTGYIPKSQNHFGTGYLETCRKAVSELKQERQATSHRRSSDLPAAVNYFNQQPERQKPPLTAISDKVFSYKPVKPFVPLGNPYVMDDDDPHKYFISGFTGHIPKSRTLFGKGFPITTNQALIQFGEQQRADPTSPNVTGRKDRSVTTAPTIYPSHKGVVPSFTGHIPGYRFTYGQTFGQLSKDALEKSGIRRNPQDKS